MNEIMEVKNFNLATFSEDMAAGITEELEGLGTIPFDYAKIPAGGGLAFEVGGTDEENPESVSELIGILLWHHPLNSYWKKELSSGSEPPDCISYDGITGVNRLTGEIQNCKTCSYNQFGSKNRGKACKNMQKIYFLRESSLIPIVLTLPPTSLKYIRDYLAKQVLLKGLRSHEVVTKITLKREKNAESTAYSRVAFTLLGKLSPVQIEQVNKLREELKQTKQTEELKQTKQAEEFVEIEEGEFPFC